MESTELKFEAPLAQFESEDFVDLCPDLQSLCDLKNGKKGLESLKKCLDEENNDVVVVETDSNFMETFSGSLEDLVNTFDEKITKCFCNYDETTEKLAPVQMRSQEELMNDCQMWWTITGNYGNILPIDWSKTYTRKLQIPALNLNEQVRKDEEEYNSLSDEDEAVASDLDMHSLILGRSHDSEPEPPTADEVIKEIDFIMQDSPASDCCSSDELGSCSCQDKSEKGRNCSAPFYQDKLNELSVCELNEVLMELESQIKENSEVLIAELALRDELEYEKELKNSFISHLLAVQTKRRQHNLDRKKNKNGDKNSAHAVQQSKYLTTVIPYHAANGPPENPTLQVLIKILKAIEQDSPTVPTLLTDYILKVLCPT
ncbi:unnamed protein product [Allacma fusca]|uniref:Fasciculation and elongation protein zeta-2 n=1 Tax=Allacma fusca TaxID=39272 RepID=A0A8J2NRR2_9HEXA|nr:unnamed protein product [Allacma fusca]